MKSFFYTLVLIFLSVIVLVSKTPPAYATNTFSCGYDSSLDICKPKTDCPIGYIRDDNLCYTKSPNDCDPPIELPCIAPGSPTPTPAQDCTNTSVGGYCAPLSQGCYLSGASKHAQECDAMASGGITYMCCLPPSPSITPCPGGYCGIVVSTPPPEQTIPTYDPTCTAGTSYYGYKGVKTALGCLPTDPQYFINLVTPWAIGIGSGIAFLLGLYGSLMIVISAGDPEKMQAGKEIITSAIAGLLLIVFAVFILRIIGVDVLKLF